MHSSDDIKYFRQREAEEREAAERSQREVRGVHERLAEGYAMRIASAGEGAEYPAD